MNEIRKQLAYPGPGAGVSLHNHSQWSDGTAPAETMVRAAKAAGIKIFGLSDHFVRHPAPSVMPVSWSIDLNRPEEYFTEMQKLKDEFNDENFTLLSGFEVDYFSENHEAVLEELEQYPADYLIGSVHYAGTFPIDHSAVNWEKLAKKEIDPVCRIYWKNLFGAARSGRFAFLGHMDLPKKFGFLPDPDRYLPEALQVLDAAAASGTPIELNTSGWFKPCAEPYPSLKLLKEANRRKIPVIINPDAHCPEHVTRGFAEALQLLRQAGYPL